MAATKINKDQFQQEVLDQKGLVFVDFYAEWCVSPDTKILLKNKNHYFAKDIQKGNILLGLGKNKKDFGEVSYSQTVNDEGHCKKITLETGREIKLTDNHFLYTPLGWKAANVLKTEDKVAVYPDYDTEPIPNHINEKDLILARLIGFIFTDGTLYHQQKNHYFEVSFSVGQIDDVKQLKEDLSSLGFAKLHIKEVTKNQEISGRKFTTHVFRIKCLSKKLFTLLVEKGTPVGAKKSQHYLVPKWIKDGSRAIKREFLRGYLGGDGPKVTALLVSRQKGNSYDKFGINDLEFHKDSDLEKSGLALGKEIKTLLKEFDVEIVKIYIEKDNYLRDDGKKSSIIHIEFKHDIATAYALSQKVGYTYCKQKGDPSLLVGEFLRRIFYLRKLWTNKYEKVKQLAAQGHGYRYISRILNIHPSQSWSWIKNKAKATTAKHGLRFGLWVKERLINAPKGFIWEKVSDIKPIFLPSVSKITVEKTHSFIANGFLSHNCGPCKMTEPIIHGLSEEMKDVKFIQVNVDENPELASQYSVFSIPTFVMFKNGKTVSQAVGAMGKEAFVAEINKAKNG